MAICNRDLGTGQQQNALSQQFGAFSTGASNAPVTVPLALIPYPSTLQQIKVGALGLSGTPILDVKVNRFIIGSGNTVYLGGLTTLTLVDKGTSGIQPIVGTSVMQLQAGDEIVGILSGQDSAVTSLATSVVIQAAQDIVSYFGS